MDFNLTLSVVLVSVFSWCLGLNQTLLTLTDKERVLLKEFRSMVSDVIVHNFERTDGYLIRYLRTKHLHLHEANELFRETQKWRKDNHIDTIVNETLLNVNPPAYSFNGYDKEGSPILTFAPTHIDFRRFLNQGLLKKSLRYGWQMLERATVQTRVASQLFGKEINQVVAILDADGYNPRQHFCLACINAYKDFIPTLERYYPLGIKHLVVINVPRSLTPLAEILQPFVSLDTAKVFKAFSPNRPEWTSYLHKIVPLEQLPFKFGGPKKVGENSTLSADKLLDKNKKLT